MNLRLPFLLSLLALSFVLPVLGQTRTIPHITRVDGSFATTLRLTNTSSQAETITITGYNEQGVLVTTNQFPLAAGRQTEIAAAAQFPSDLSHLNIDGPVQVLVSVDYLAETQGAAPATISEKPAKTTWRFIAGDWSKTYDALAVVNRGGANSTITLRQYENNGSLVLSRSLNAQLGPNQKQLYVVSAGDFPASSGYFELTAQQPVAVTALRGNSDSTILWENTIFPADPTGLAQMRLLQGIWYLVFAVNNTTFDATFSLAYLEETPLDGLYYVYGMDTFGNVDVAAYYEDGQWAILDLGSLFNQLFVFDLDGDGVEGCYYQVSNGNSSNCFQMAGGRVTVQNKQSGKTEPPILSMDGTLPAAHQQKLDRLLGYLKTRR